MEAEGVDDSFKKFGRRCPERKGRELERVADSSRGFLCRKPARGESVSKTEGSGGTKLLFDRPGSSSKRDKG